MKNILSNIKGRLGAGALSLLAVALPSCADMLAPESDLVMYEEDNQLNTVNDTIFSVMGIVHRLQQVADRTNLLGEVRGDLVKVTPAATVDLQALASFDADVDNKYNHPEDFYAIINNCNYFIENADMELKRQGQRVFEKEAAVMHTFRAWAYLQLVTTYGEVPFYTEFLGTQEAANQVMKQPRKGIAEICSWLIEDLQPWVDTYELDYGAIFSFESTHFFIPVRVMLGELCLWTNRYEEAAMYYHDYLNHRDNPQPIKPYSIGWATSDRPAIGWHNSYVNTFGSTDNLTFIPMESTTFEGTISYLDDIYESTSENDYYYQLTWSESLVELSAAQAYYYVYVDSKTNLRDTFCMTSDTIVARELDRTRVGDMRLFGVVTESAVNNKNNNRLNDNFHSLLKIDTEMIPIYRLPLVYLHYAEALNRAGFPTAAFAVLKYGLCQETLQRPEGNPIAAYEREHAGELLSFDQYRFNKTNTIGIHARGCGDVDANPEYVLPMPADSLPAYTDTIAFLQPIVENLIVDELALETCFEGNRFYDLMRVALRRNDPAYLADRVANRTGEMDATLHGKLLNSANWFLPLRSAE